MVLQPPPRLFDNTNTPEQMDSFDALRRAMMSGSATYAELALRIIHQSSTANRPMAFADIIDHPVLTFLAAHLNRVHTLSSDKPSETYSPWVPLMTSGPDAPTIFVFPGAGMSSTSFRHFAVLAKGRYTLIGLDAPGLIPGQHPLKTVEEAAAIFAKTICAAAPTGNVHLIGHSFGAILAFATAQLLRDWNASISSLAFFDPPSPFWGQDTPSLETLRHDFVTGLGDALSCPVAPLLQAAASRDTPSFMAVVSAWLVAYGTLPDELDTPILSSRFNTYCAARKAQYRPNAVYPGITHLFLSNTPGPQETVAGWIEHLQNMTFNAISASHHGMLLPPHVRTVFRLWHDIRTRPVPPSKLHRNT